MIINLNQFKKKSAHHHLGLVLLILLIFNGITETQESLGEITHPFPNPGAASCEMDK